nr:mpv17-like protein 2 [Leptinotarsa decemlineata]
MLKLRNCITGISKFHKCFTNATSRKVSTSSPKFSPIRVGISSVFGKYLLATNIISSGALMLIGDICQQEIEYRQRKLEKRYDYGRMTRMFIVGLAFGPVHHYYYIWLAKAYPAKTATNITWKILLDQFIMSPVCIAMFFYGMGLMEMKPVVESNKEITEKFREVYTI